MNHRIEPFTLVQDISVMYIQASSFPEGVLEAHQRLHRLVQPSNNRKYFGISHPDHGQIIYKAACEELKQGEADQFNCERFTIQKGEFTSILIENFMEDIQSIGDAFQELLKNPDVDPNGYCLEWYINDTDVRCLVPLKK